MLIMITGGSGSGKSEFAEQCCMKLCPGEKIYIATMQPFGAEGAARIQRHKKLRAGKHFQTVECYTNLGELDLNIHIREMGQKIQMDVESRHTLVIGKDCTNCGSAVSKDDELWNINTMGIDCTNRNSEVWVDAESRHTPVIKKDCTNYGSTVLLECLSNLAANEMFTNALDEMQTADKIIDGICKLRTQAEHLVVVTNEVFSDGITYEQETIRYMKALAHANVRLAAMADMVCEVVCGIPVVLKGKDKDIF